MLISLGFTLATPLVWADGQRYYLPPRFYTPSDCMSDLYPHPALLGGLGEEECAKHYAMLGLTVTEGAVLTKQLQNLFEGRRWGLDSVFVEKADAQAFARRWLKQVPELKLLGMELPVSWLPSFIAVFTDDNGKDTSYQGRAFAAQANQQGEGGKPLGFEVLGVSAWSDAHTSACSNVRVDFRQGFGAEFNQHGFLTSLEQAELAAREYMFEENGVGIEECEWFPIRVTEHPLEGGR